MEGNLFVKGRKLAEKGIEFVSELPAPRLKIKGKKESRHNARKYSWGNDFEGKIL